MWRTANDIGELVDTAFGSWTRAELEDELEETRKADAQISYILRGQKAARTKRERGTQTSPERGEYPCPECGQVLATPGARGAHRERKHDILGRRSLRSA